MQPSEAPSDRFTPVLNVISVSKRYPTKEAVKDLSFTVQAGEIVGLLGPNGAGKTTTMKMIAGLLRPTAGSIWIAGHNVVHDPVGAKRCLFFVPDTPSPFSGMTGVEYLNFVASVYQIPVPDRQARLAPYIQGMSLDGHLTRNVSEYSHGMKQKLVLAAAFMVAPRLLMLDEPLIGLDTHAAAFLKDCLRKHTAAGGSVLLSTHLMFLAEELCHQVVILSEGRQLAAGTLTSLPSQAGNRPGNLETLFLEMTNRAPEV